jgi:hypothetical protein
MLQRLFSSRRLIVAALLLTALTAVTASQAQDNTKRGRKYKAPPPTAKIAITVIRASSGRPIENASVIFHPLEDGKNAGNMELKTNDEGKAMMDLLDVGSNVRLQIIAPGFQTYGEDFKIEKDTMALEIKMKRPGEQYSIYKKHEEKSDDKSADPKSDSKADPKADPKPDAPSETKPEAPKSEAKPTPPNQGAALQN